MTKPALPEPTFDRLLQVAVDVFAEAGFQQATVREICSRANVNVASVNYYFRSKEALYVQALKFAFNKACENFSAPPANPLNIPPDQCLAIFVESFLQKLLDNTSLGALNQLIAKEIYAPTPAFEEILALVIVPHFQQLQAIISPILPEAEPHCIARCMLSIIGQCLMYKHSRSIIDHLYPDLIADQSAIQATAAHITQFSLNALQQTNVTQ